MNKNPDFSKINKFFDIFVAEIRNLIRYFGNNVVFQKETDELEKEFIDFIRFTENKHRYVTKYNELYEKSYIFCEKWKKFVLLVNDMSGNGFYILKNELCKNINILSNIIQELTYIYKKFFFLKDSLIELEQLHSRVLNSVSLCNNLDLGSSSSIYTSLELDVFNIERSILFQIDHKIPKNSSSSSKKSQMRAKVTYHAGQSLSIIEKIEMFPDTILIIKKQAVSISQLVSNLNEITRIPLTIHINILKQIDDDISQQ